MSRLLLNLRKEFKHDTSRKFTSSAGEDTSTVMMTTMRFDGPADNNGPQNNENGDLPTGEHQYIVNELRNDQPHERDMDNNMGVANGIGEP